ncbi:M16 family metallopeptidase [Sphingobium subterraneum]|uniref:Zinc protease n=1 Tax=Sphingobium subterraneum TaxID=627688 RepID=A0A841IXV2_9SPHN|nr:M16 family metallopeptidase [Sphingobium subterraneum]MBB6123204.1 zinc protease [Sphingobium subterraneum]
MTHRSARALLSLSFVALIWSGVAAPLQAKSVVRPAAPVVRKVPPLPVRKPAVAAPVVAKALAPVAAPRPWLYENSDVPIDTQWLFGTLPNGLRYAIRNNGVPPGQVSVRLRIDAGSLMERDNELGFAHFMEHLTFRGSKYVPDGESKRIWQRLGVSFGSDSNAQTTPTGTTYALDLPQAVPDSLNESLKILAGMMTDPNIVPAAVDAERAVVLAEMREGMGPGTKVADATRELYFAGQLLAKRSPIGTPETLTAARADALQAFHDRWYRPENAVISISGDIDRKQAEALIIQNFGAWKRSGTAAPQPDFGAPDPKAPTSAVVVQPGVPITLSLAWLRPWRPKADTIVYNQGKLSDMVALQLINRRLEQAARGTASFLSASVDVQDVSRSVDGTFVSIVPIGKDWQKALNDVRAVIEDAKATPPTEQDIAREYAQFDTSLAVLVENQDTEASAKQASDIASAVDIRETTVSPETALGILRSARPQMTPAAMLAATRRMFTSDAMRAMLVLPTAEQGAEQKLATTLATPVAAASNIRLSSDAVTMDDLPKLGPPGKVVATETQPLGMQIITFANGVKLTLFANTAESGKVRINVRFGHGQQDLSPRQTVPSGPAGYILAANGIGKLGQRDLDELTNGRRLGFDFGIDDDAFEMAALTRPADYRDQLKLFATKLAAPAWDPAPIERTKAALTAAQDSMSGSPDAVLGRDLMWLLRDRDARFLTPGAKEVAALTPAAFRAQWEPILAAGPIEVQVFGDVKADEAVAAVAATFGALPPRAETKPSREGRTLKFPKHNKTPLVLFHDGDPDQAAATIAWPTGSGFAQTKDARRLDILAQIISDRLFEKLRSIDGASYSPQAQSNWPFAYEKSKGYLVVSSQLKPERIDYFYALIGDIVTDLASKPVSADELQRTTAPMRQLLSRASTGNAFWMNQMEGATRDPRYIAVMKSLGSDLLEVTAADLQVLARKYLVPKKSYSVVVLPRQAAAKR